MKFQSKYLPLVTWAIFAAIFFTGCDSGDSNSLWDQIKQLGREKSELKVRSERLEAENEVLTNQVQRLSALGPEVRVEALSGLSMIKISKRSGVFDKDKDGRKEKLIVYVRPIDETGDVIKAAGAVDVQLWDLNASSGEALIGQWTVEPEALKTLWSGTVMTNYYRLTFDVKNLLVGETEELTVKVQFTDYVTGKIFREQKVIKPE